jgi:hypothetical protein
MTLWPRGRRSLEPFVRAPCGAPAPESCLSHLVRPRDLAVRKVRSSLCCSSSSSTWGTLNWQKPIVAWDFSTRLLLCHDLAARKDDLDLTPQGGLRLGVLLVVLLKLLLDMGHLELAETDRGLGLQHRLLLCSTSRHYLALLGQRTPPSPLYTGALVRHLRRVSLAMQLRAAARRRGRSRGRPGVPP